MSRFNNGTISVRQFTILIILGVIGDSILIMPMMIAASARQDSWLSMLMAVIIGIAFGGILALLANKLRSSSLFAFTRQNFGLGLGGLVCGVFLLQFFMCCLTLLSEMSQFMTTQMMPETPINAIILVFILVIIIAYRYGVEAFARMGELLFPLFMLLFLFLITFLIPQVDMSNLRPIAAEGIGTIYKGFLPAFVTGFAEMLILLMLVPYVSGSKSLTKPILTGFAIGGFILFIVVFICVLVLGPNLMQTKYYPTFVLAQKITIGHFLERLEAVMAFLWFISVFYKTLLLYFSLTSGFAELFRLKESHMLTIPIGMILLVGTITGTPNIAVYNDILMKYFVQFDMSICVLLPTLLLIWMYIRDQRNKGKTMMETDS